MDQDYVDLDIAEVFGASETRQQRFAIYIPNKDQNGQPVEQAQWLTKALTLLSEICGGATAMPPVRGAWLNSETKNLVIEEPILVYTYIDPKPFVDKIQEIVDLVHEIGRETNQGQMAIEFESVLYLIDIEPK
ncbi:MAG: hypothetical protein WCA85_32840 [Paraburkholderia sp.]|uniref:hypothetical protein n=1 Tax=Paraburkholderia sp. TaxID=1926495 RepID=UPI003C564950